MSQYNIDLHHSATLTRPAANDNRDWAADPYLALRVYSEWRLRYRRIDPKGLTPERRRLRLQLLRLCLDNIRFCWQWINGDDPAA